MLKQDYVPRVTQVLSKSHSWRWPISPLFSVTASSSCCLKHNRRSEGVVKSEAPKNIGFIIRKWAWKIILAISDRQQ